MTARTSRLHRTRARAFIIWIAGWALALAAAPVAAQNTVGVIEYDPKLAYPGYTLLAPNPSTTTYLIDIEGNLVRAWSARHRLIGERGRATHRARAACAQP